MEDANISKVEIRPSPISGHGSFAKEKISRGEYITTLSGQPNTAPEIWNKCESLGISENDPLQIGENLFLILNRASKTINHSCDPNAGLRNISDLFAVKDINIGDEITYDYSTTTGANDTMEMVCHCGSKNCRKKIGNVLSMPQKLLEKYITENALQDFIKLQLSKIGKLETHTD